MLFHKQNTHKHTKEEIEEARVKLKETKFEKGDTLALIIAAMITIVPVVFIMITLIIGVLWLFFLR